jgi:hypothetical protein
MVSFEFDLARTCLRQNIARGDRCAASRQKDSETDKSKPSRTPHQPAKVIDLLFVSRLQGTGDWPDATQYQPHNSKLPQIPESCPQRGDRRKIFNISGYFHRRHSHAQWFTSDMKSGRINVGFGVFSRRCPSVLDSQDGLEFTGPLRQHPLRDPIAIDENVRASAAATVMAHQYDLFFSARRISAAVLR